MFFGGVKGEGLELAAEGAMEEGGVAVWQGDKVKRVGAKWGGIVGEGAMRQS